MLIALFGIRVGQRGSLCPLRVVEPAMAPLVITTPSGVAVEVGELAGVSVGVAVGGG